MYILRELRRFEDFENLKIFRFVMLFCNQNDLDVKIWVFAKSAHQNTKSCRNKKTSNYFQRLFSGRGQVVFFWSPTIFGRYSAGKMNFGQICWCMHQQNFFKIDFFRFLRNCMKCILNVIYTLKNVFKHLWGYFPSIFGHRGIALKTPQKVPKYGGFAKVCPMRHENFTFGHLGTPICVQMFS